MERQRNIQPLTENFANENGLINQKQLFEHLYGKTKKVGVRSDLKPSAQMTLLYAGGNDWEVIHKAVETAMDKMFKHDLRLFYFTEIMLLGACRVSEVLAIRPYDITLTGLVKINSLKHGSHRLISTGRAKEFILKCRKNGIYPFDYFNRFYIYREFKRYGVPTIVTGANRHAVTHIFRHLQTAEIRAIDNDKELIKSHLGHKSISSQKNYGR